MQKKGKKQHKFSFSSFPDKGVKLRDVLAQLIYQFVTIVRYFDFRQPYMDVKENKHY